MCCRVLLALLSTAASPLFVQFPVAIQAFDLHTHTHTLISSLIATVHVFIHALFILHDASVVVRRNGLCFCDEFVCVCVCAVTLPPIHQQQVAGTKNPTSRTQRPSRARWVHWDGRTDSSSQATDTCSPPPPSLRHITHTPSPTRLLLLPCNLLFSSQCELSSSRLPWLCKEPRCDGLFFFFFPPFFFFPKKITRLRKVKGRGEIKTGSRD